LRNRTGTSTTSTSVDTKGISESFDDLAHDRCCKYKEKGLTNSSGILLDLLVKNDLAGKSYLEIGCGTGFFAMETSRKGTASITGFDLSSAAIQEANGYAKELGFGDRAKFEVGDGAIVPMPSSDIVVMDKVLCCYPDYDALLKNASDASKQMLGFIVPRDEGWMKPFMRCGAAAINLVEKLRRTGFKFYLHPLGSIHGQLVEKGFHQAEKAKSRVWLIFLYKKNENSPRV
jgi:SAM-dependent methyltransferase